MAELSRKGAAFLRTGEGFEEAWYLDPVKVPTIGVGFTWRSTSFRKWWTENKPGVAFAKGATMTRTEAEDALMFMAREEYGAALNKFLTGTKDVPQHVWDGSFSPVYNLGAGSLKWKWAAALKKGDWVEAARLLKTTGTTAGGKTLNGLIKRRKEEAELIALGDYVYGNQIDADPLTDGILKRGERGDPVLQLQKKLTELGLYKGKPDGKFGYGTEAAVLAYQRADDELADDGWASPKTLAKLGLEHLLPQLGGDPGLVPEKKADEPIIVAGEVVSDQLEEPEQGFKFDWFKVLLVAGLLFIAYNFIKNTFFGG